MSDTIGRSLGTDYFRIADQLTSKERDYLRRARDFVDGEVLPVINDYWERAEFPWPLIKAMAGLGIGWGGTPLYGRPPMSPIATGLVHMELNRGDGSLGTFLGVHAGLAMEAIAMLGSDEQKARALRIGAEPCGSLLDRDAARSCPRSSSSATTVTPATGRHGPAPRRARRTCICVGSRVTARARPQPVHLVLAFIGRS